MLSVRTTPSSKAPQRQTVDNKTTNSRITTDYSGGIPKQESLAGINRNLTKRAALLRAALSFAERGRPVVPLHSIDGRGRCTCGGPEVNPKCKPGKHPRTTKGHLDATTDPRRIHAWWNRWPEANIGIPTGERSGILALDVDPDNGGNESLDDLLSEHGELPETTTTRTGRGGMHYLFTYPAGSEIRNSAGALGAGLDVRGEGGYIVAPPSRTEGAYEWLERHAPTDAPDWLLELLRSEPRSSDNRSRCDNPAKVAISADIDGPEIPDGQRNDTLTRIAGALRARGLDLERLESELQAVNQRRCSPPLEASEVAGVARSICRRYPAGDASPEPPPEVLTNVEALFAQVLERLEWKGMAGATDRAVYVALLLTARKHGRGMKHGVKVYISVRALALLAGTSRRTAINALRRLREKRLVSRSSEGRGNKAGALVLRVPQVCTTQPPGGEYSESGASVRDVVRELLRLRYGAGRVGKTAAHILELVARSGSETTIGELVAGTGRRRDNVRRTLRRLEPRALVECSGENVRLVADFAAALELELESTGITLSERLDREKYEREREGYKALFRERRRGRNAYREYLEAIEADKKPVGATSELERVESSEPLEKPDSPGPIPTPTGEQNPDPVITDANDPDKFRELVATARRKIAEHRRGALPLRQAERVEKLPPEDASVLEAIEAFEDKHGPGSFKWNHSGAKELFYSVAGGHWPLPDQLRRIREYVESARVAAA